MFILEVPKKAIAKPKAVAKEQKEEIGSVTRHSISAISGFVLSKVVDKLDLDAETLKSILEVLEYIVEVTPQILSRIDGLLAVLGIVLPQVWSIYHKKTKKKQIKELEDIVENRHYENVNP